MITLDLFESDDNKPQTAYVPVGPYYPGSKNRALGNANIAAIMKSLDTPNTPPVTLNFLDGTSRQLTPEEINLIADHYETLPSKADRANFIYRTLLSRNKMFQLLYRLKQGQLNFDEPAKNQEPPAPEQLNLFQEEKKSSEQKFKSTRLDRLKTQARARYPAAGSDIEAMVADFVDQQDQDQDQFNQVKTVNRRQDDLLKQITALNKSQEKEIDNLEAEEVNLQQNIQQLKSANAELARKLAGMSARRQPADQAPAASATPAAVTMIQQPSATVAPVAGVSVATDKVKQPRTMRYSPIGQNLTRKPGQLARGPVGTASIDGKDVDILAPRTRLKTADIPGALRGGLRQQAMEVQDIPFGMTEDQSIPARAVIQGYTVDYDAVKRMVTVNRRGQLVGRALNKPGSYKNYQLVVNRIIDSSEEDKYPADLETRSVERPVAEALPAKAARELHRWKNMQRVGDVAPQVTTPEPTQVAQEPEEPPVERGEEMTAQDLLFRTAAKAMYDAGQQGVDMDYETAIRTASRLMRIPYAPSQLPALRSQLAQVQQKIDTMKAVKKSKRAREQEKLTHQTTPDEERRAKQFWQDYNKRFRRVSENKDSRAYEQGSREGYYGRPNRNPYDAGTEEHADYNRGYRDFRDEGKDYLRELDLDRSGQPMYQAQDVYMLTHNGREVAFYKLKDLKRAEQDAQDMQKKLGGEVHLRKVMRETDQPTPGDDILKNLFRDFGEIFDKQQQPPTTKEPEKKEVNEMGRAGYNPLTSEQHWHEVEKYLFDLINNKNLDAETRAEAKQRYLEKQREAKLKGFK